MPKHRDTRFKGGELRPMPPPPCASEISNKEARDENRRLKEKSEHGIHPNILPSVSIARIWGDIMIGTAENLPCPTASCG
jgi:hypothetical protein